MSDRGQSRVRRVAAAAVVVLAVAGLVQLIWPRPTTVAGFSSPAGRAAYLEAYDQSLAGLPGPTHVHDIATDSGSVHVNEWNLTGTAAPAVVLLPGTRSGGPMWRDLLIDLIPTHRVFVIDTLSDAGRSLPAVPITTMDQHAGWLIQTVRTLDVAPVHLVGHSYGGGLATAMTLEAPDLVASLTLLEPIMTLAGPPASTYLWATVSMLPLPQSWREHALSRIGGEEGPIDLSDPVARMISVASRDYRGDVVMPTVLSDEQLRTLTMPVYVAIADHRSLAGGVAAADRARTMIPDATVVVWPNTTHSLPMQAGVALIDDLQEFWAGR